MLPFEPDDLFDLGAYMASKITWRFDRDLHLFVMSRPSPLHEHPAKQTPVLVLELAKQAAASQGDESVGPGTSARTRPWMQILETVSACPGELYFPRVGGHDGHDGDTDTSGTYDPSVPTKFVAPPSDNPRSSGQHFHRPWYPEPDNCLRSLGNQYPAMIFEIVVSHDVPLRAKSTCDV